MVTRTLICVGGPLAGEVYEVHGDHPAIQFPVPASGVTEDRAVYAIERVVFNNRMFQVLLHPPLLAQNPDAQTDALMQALCKPEAYQSWRDGIRRTTNPERLTL